MSAGTGVLCYGVRGDGRSETSLTLVEFYFHWSSILHILMVIVISNNRNVRGSVLFVATNVKVTCFSVMATKNTKMEMAPNLEIVCSNLS